MATKQITVPIIEHVNTRNGQIYFEKGSNGVEVRVLIELDSADTESEVFKITNAILTDGSSVLTSQERIDLFSSLKKLYDYAVLNMPGYTP